MFLWSRQTRFPARIHGEFSPPRTKIPCDKYHSRIIHFYTIDYIAIYTLCLYYKYLQYYDGHQLAYTIKSSVRWYLPAEGSGGITQSEETYPVCLRITFRSRNWLCEEGSGLQTHAVPSLEAVTTWSRVASPSRTEHTARTSAEWLIISQDSL